VIVIGNEKGGSGKSTTAMHVIVSLIRRDYRVASIDLDGRQGTLSRYFENRKATVEASGVGLPLPEHFALRPDDAVSPHEMARSLGSLVQSLRSEFDYIVFDTPGSDTPLSRVGHSFADTLITPMNDSFVDLDLLARVDGESLEILGPSLYSEMVWEQKKARAQRDGGSVDWIVMRNRLSTLDARNKRDIEGLIMKLSRRMGFRIAPGFGERVVFREMFLKGLTLLDLRDMGAASWRMNLSHVAARQEVRSLMDALQLDRPRRVGTPRGQGESGRGQQQASVNQVRAAG
ncbi:MAG: division plane positioning ATPase MipZ, partial [Pseudomonadota bacterium]